MLNPDEIYLAEYSVQQGCFHIETARRACECNVRLILQGRETGYVPFAFCATYAEASRACDVFEARINASGGRPGLSAGPFKRNEVTR